MPMRGYHLWLFLIYLLKFSVVQQCGDQHHEAGTGVINQCAGGLIERSQHRQGISVPSLTVPCSLHYRIHQVAVQIPVFHIGLEYACYGNGTAQLWIIFWIGMLTG